MDSSIAFQPGDIILTSGDGFISKLIKKFSAAKDEEPTVVNHVGMVLSYGHNPIIIEALWKTKIHHLDRAYADSSSKITIYRMKGLTEHEKTALSDTTFGYANQAYGFLKLIPHLLDSLIGNKYFFRRMMLIKNYPICSWLVALAYKRVLNFEFGVPYRAAQPDDIYDFIIRSNAFECIYPLDYYYG